VSSDSIDFDRVNPSRTRFGRLSWRGGLVLSSQAPEFGGWSGIDVTDGGEKLFAVSDQGSWLMGELVYENGRLAALRKVRVGPLKARNGKNLRRKKYADAEEISLWRKKGRPYALISFERAHRIGRFPLSSKGVEKPSSYLKLPKGAYKTTKNKGIEAMTVLRDKKHRGTVLFFLERRHDKRGNHKGWLLFGRKSSPIRLTYRDGFDITGLTTLPNGDVVVLERSVGLFSGVQMRLRLVKARNIKPRAVLDGEILLTASMRYHIDNMEGVASHVNERGETIITLISDDNFNSNGLQQTVLLQFALDADKMRKRDAGNVSPRP
jgi:hypothetical protein